MLLRVGQPAVDILACTFFIRRRSDSCQGEPRARDTSQLDGQSDDVLGLHRPLDLVRGGIEYKLETSQDAMDERHERLSAEGCDASSLSSRPLHVKSIGMG